ncbi:MAG TPA: winged helix-turn-helix domain-containing protein [Bryobacteraceae bacterium]|jgi:DNA-binding winged helix-turn-helix (wHTH) protein/Flp pilus assembly protein TadD|nr:winged helix-turn-helix domain-containing protein [Bryobacteraceae bacterium]
MSGRLDGLFHIEFVRINSRTRTIERDGQSVPLPSRAFDMLLLLIERQGDVVSKEELLSRIWGDTHVEESNLPVMISAIRRAIGDDSRQQRIIQTVPRSGYRFVGEVVVPETDVADSETATQAVPVVEPVIAYPDVPAPPVPPQVASNRKRAFSLTTAFAIAAMVALVVVSGSMMASRHAAASSRAVPESNTDEFPPISDAHIGQGMVLLMVDRNFARAAQEFRKAAELDPRSSLAEDELGLCLVATGQTDEAVVHARRAKALDPLSTRAAADLGLVLYYSRRFTEAETELKDVLKLDPDSYRPHINLAKTYLQLGKFEEARRVLEETSLLSNHDPQAEGLMAEAEALTGNRQGAEAILSALQRRAQTSYVSPVGIAFALAGLGRTDEALLYLQKAQASHSVAALFFKVDPAWNSLREDRRFRDLTRDISTDAAE